MTKEEIKKQVEEKYLALKQKTYFISFVALYIKKTKFRLKSILNNRF